MSNTLVMLVAAEAAEAAKKAGPKLEDRLRAAMKVAANHWGVTSENEQFLGACEGAARTCTEEEVERINDAVRMINAFSALVSGVPVDFSAFEPPEGEDRPEPLKLMPMWREIKDGET